MTLPPWKRHLKKFIKRSELIGRFNHPHLLRYALVSILLTRKIGFPEAGSFLTI